MATPSISSYFELIYKSDTCSVIKVKEGSENDLIKTGYFDGDETIFRLTVLTSQGNTDKELTIWRKDGSYSGITWGSSVSCVGKGEWTRFNMVADVIKNLRNGRTRIPSFTSLVKLAHHDNTCAILKVKEDKAMDLICLGFGGDETMFRWTTDKKANFNELTTWHASGKITKRCWGSETSYMSALSKATLYTVRSAIVNLMDKANESTAKA